MSTTIAGAKSLTQNRSRGSSALEVGATEFVRALIRDLESNDTTWTQPWVAALSGGHPINASTSKQYNGSNVWTLLLAAIKRGYSGPQWGTYKQWDGLGAQVQRGQKGTVGIYAGRYAKDEDTETGKVEWGYSLRSFTLFHRDQTDAEAKGVAPDPEPPALPEVVDSLDPLSALVEQVYADREITRHDRGHRAYYEPAIDTIILPVIESFTSAEGYYITAMHEACHWTGHEERLGRPGITPATMGKFGSPDYAREELTTELAAMLVASHHGVETMDEDTEHRSQSVAYIRSWLQDGPADRIWDVVRDAEKAARWIIDGEPVEEVSA